MNHALILAMSAHVALTAVLYALLTVARAPSAWGIGRRPDGRNPWEQIEPRISANLSNQFEWPLFFHIGCICLIVYSNSDPIAKWLAWTFIFGRVLHSLVQILTSNIRWRGLVFTINFLAVLGLWFVLVKGLLAGN